MSTFVSSSCAIAGKNIQLVVRQPPLPLYSFDCFNILCFCYRFKLFGWFNMSFKYTCTYLPIVIEMLQKDIVAKDCAF